MSTEGTGPLPRPPLTLSQYLVALIDTLGANHPLMLARMRLIVGRRRACIILDDEEVEVAFTQEGLSVQQPPGPSKPSGHGETDTATVLELINGYLEVSDAILSGRLRVFGEADDIIRMFMAIELLLDSAPRTPALQSLSARFERERRAQRLSPNVSSDRVSWYPFHVEVNELDLLRDLDLLPDSTH